MKKRITAILLTVVLLLSCSACHGARERNVFEVPEHFDDSRQYELTFWAKNDTNVTQTQIYEKAIRDFENLYPNIKINVRLYTDYSRIYNDVITNIATNTTPNVCITYPDHIATYLTGNQVVVPLDDLMTDSAYGLGGDALRFDSPGVKEVVPQFLQEGKFQDHYYALPYMRSTEACYVNKTYVEKLGYTLDEPLTWDFIWEVSEAAMAKDEKGNFLVNGQSVMIPFIYKSTDNMMIQMTRQLGSGYTTASGEVQIFNDTTKELLNTIAEHVKTGAFSTFKVSSYPANFLNAGQCIFAIDSTAGSTWMGTNAPLLDIAEDQVVDFETAVMPIPQFDPERPQMISQGPSLCVFNKQDPQEVLASWLFAQFLLTNEVQIGYSQTEGYVPVTTKAQNDPGYQEYLAKAGEDNKLHYDVKLKATEILINNVGNTFTTPVYNGSASLRDAAGQMIEETVKSVRRKQTVDDVYFEKLFENMTALYRLDQFGGQGGNQGRQNLGPLPVESRVLLGTLLTVWLIIAVFAILDLKKQKKNRHN